MSHVDAVENSIQEGNAEKSMAGIHPKPVFSGRCHGIKAGIQGAIAEDEDSDASSNFSPHRSSQDSDSASEEGETEVVGESLDMEGFLKN
jgi:hypothetical protein